MRRPGFQPDCQLLQRELGQRDHAAPGATLGLRGSTESTQDPGPALLTRRIKKQCTFVVLSQEGLEWFVFQQNNRIYKSIGRRSLEGHLLVSELPLP